MRVSYSVLPRHLELLKAERRSLAPISTSLDAFRLITFFSACIMIILPLGGQRYDRQELLSALVQLFMYPYAEILVWAEHSVTRPLIQLSQFDFAAESFLSRKSRRLPGSQSIQHDCRAACLEFTHLCALKSSRLV